MPNLLQNKKLVASDNAWLENIRQQGFDAFVLPNTKVESFKYTKLFDLKADDFIMDSKIVVKEKKALPFDAYEIHFNNGVLDSDLSIFPKTIEVCPIIKNGIKQEVEDLLANLADYKKHPFVALNNAYLQEGVYIKVAKNTVVDKPIAIINHTSVGDENLFYNIHNLVVVENGAKAELVEYACYNGELKSRYFANIVSEIYVQDYANLTHYKIQDEAFKAIHIANNFINVEQNALYKNICLQKGANLARNEINAKLVAHQATAETNTIYKISGWATIDTTTNIEHLCPHTFSNTYVKGVVDGDARGVFQGKVHIAKNAIKTEGKQLHRALLLSNTAEVDCKPELEIFADDVKCAHGASSGELDANQLFYMRSRGIDEETARQILVEAFLNDIIYKIENVDIREWFMNYV